MNDESQQGQEPTPKKKRKKIDRPWLKTKGCPKEDRFRCAAYPKHKNGERCKLWRMRGSKYCNFHGGRRRKRVNNSVTNFYSHKLSDTLNAAIQKQLDAPASEQLSLLQELALMRQSALTAVVIYDKTSEIDDVAIKAKAAELMAGALKNVQSVCESAARVAMMNKAGLDALALRDFVNQVVRVAADCFGDNEAVKLFEHRLRQEIKLTDQTSAKFTPDEQVRRMMELTTGTEPASGNAN